jgi:transposase-like protein
MHIGQGAELSWTFHVKQPTEDEYINMIDNSERTVFTDRLASTDKYRNRWTVQIARGSHGLRKFCG